MKLLYSDSVKNARACKDYPSVCNKNSDPICNSHSNRKEIKPLSTSWSPVNWNLSFPLLLTCNQTGEISVNLFPNILAMSQPWLFHWQKKRDKKKSERYQARDTGHFDFDQELFTTKVITCQISVSFRKPFAALFWFK